jgi:hypothetical protein
MITVRIPYNIPLTKLPWRDYPQALADLTQKNSKFKIIETNSDKESHLE